MSKFSRKRQTTQTPDDAQVPPSSQRNRAVRPAERRTSPAWPYIFWTVVSLLVLALVINYDRRSVADGLLHLTEGKRLEKIGKVDDAMAEYRLALRNTRLGNKLRAEAAVLLADLEVRERGNTDSALELLNEARRLSYRTAEQLGVPEKIDAINKRPASRNRVASRNSTVYGAGITIRQAEEETSGPVFAVLPSGRRIHMGQLVGRLARAGLLNDPTMRSSPNRLERAAAELLEEELAIDRAVARGEHLDPNLLNELWLLYRSLVRSRGEALSKTAATDEDTSAAAYALYQSRYHIYNRPGNIGLSAIYTQTSESAAIARRELQDGRTFEAVATSHSIERESAAKGGFLGLIDDNQTTLPLVGEQKELLESLRKLPLFAISAPTQVGDYWIIFRINSKQVPIRTSYEEVRNRLMTEVAARQPAHPRVRPIQDIEAEVDHRVLGQFWKIHDGKQTAITGSDSRKKDPVTE
jgi:hypothetical protein